MSLQCSANSGGVFPDADTTVISTGGKGSVANPLHTSDHRERMGS